MLCCFELRLVKFELFGFYCTVTRQLLVYLGYKLKYNRKSQTLCHRVYSTRYCDQPVCVQIVNTS